jgi:hypothetical protein
MKDNVKMLVVKIFAIGAVVSLILIPFTNGWAAAPCLIFGAGLAICFIIFSF